MQGQASHETEHLKTEGDGKGNRERKGRFFILSKRDTCILGKSGTPGEAGFEANAHRTRFGDLSDYFLRSVLCMTERPYFRRRSRRKIARSIQWCIVAARDIVSQSVLNSFIT